MRLTSARRGILRTSSTEPPQHMRICRQSRGGTAESRPKLLTRPRADQNWLVEIATADVASYLQAFGEMLGHANRIGHCGKRGVHRPDAHEKAGVNYVQIIQLMSFAVDIENGAFRVRAESAGSCLMRHTRDGDIGLEICIAGNQMFWPHTQVLEHGFQFVVEFLFWHLVLRC